MEQQFMAYPYPKTGLLVFFFFAQSQTKTQKFHAGLSRSCDHELKENYQFFLISRLKSGLRGL